MDIISKEEAARIKADKQNQLLLSTLQKLVDKPEGQWKDDLMKILTAKLQEVVEAVNSMKQPDPVAPEVSVVVENKELSAHLDRLVQEFKKDLDRLDKRMDALVNRADMEISFTRNNNGYINSPVHLKIVK